jgi:hypothetical protein
MATVVTVFIQKNGETQTKIFNLSCFLSFSNYTVYIQGKLCYNNINNKLDIN